MSDAKYLPRHDESRAAKLENHTPRWRRIPKPVRVLLVLAVAAVVFGAGDLAGHVHLGHGEQPRAVDVTSGPGDIESLLDKSPDVPDACLDAIAYAQQGLTLSGGHMDDMTAHIKKTGNAGRHHLTEMRPVSKKLADLQEKFDTAQKQCKGEKP